MTKPQNQSNNSNQSNRSERFINKQLPPTNTSTPMPKVKPPQQKSSKE
jgi:hypothetical protein